MVRPLIYHNLWHCLLDQDIKSGRQRRRSVCKTPMKKAPIITRIFTQRDELRLLQSMIRYKAQKGRACSSDLAAFTDFVNPFLSFHATKTQIGRKIERLRKKFQNNLKREVNGKKPINYSNKNQRKMYRLSEKIWTMETYSSDDDEAVNGDDN